MLKVLIAEDDILMADMLEDALVSNGYEVCGIARTVQKAVELGEHHKPDLAVLDVRLAEGGRGTDIASSLKQQGRVGILYATGHVKTTSLTRSDGEACIAKPYRTEDIVRGLEIVEQIVLTGGSSGPFPKGFSVLAGPPKGTPSISDPATFQADEFADYSASQFGDLIHRLRLQQNELLGFSTYALNSIDINTLMSEATRLCAACLGVPYCGIIRHRSDRMTSSPRPPRLHLGCLQASLGASSPTLIRRHRVAVSSLPENRSPLPIGRGSGLRAAGTLRRTWDRLGIDRSHSDQENELRRVDRRKHSTPHLRYCRRQFLDWVWQCPGTSDQYGSTGQCSVERERAIAGHDR